MERRDFMKSALAGAGAFAMSGLVLPAGRAYAAEVAINLSAESAVRSLGGGMTATIWQFRDTTTAGTKGPGALAAGLRVNTGDQVTVNLTNNLNRPIGFVIPGLSVTPASPTAPGFTQAYSFTPPLPGSYVFADSETDLLGRAMGLAGPLIVEPADGSQRITLSLPTFNSQYVLFLNELDTRLNAAVAAGGAGTAELGNYEPDFYFVNGISYPATEADPDTYVRLTVGQQTALRFVNGGLHLNSMHFHGYHVNVALRNRAAEPSFIEKDTVVVNVAECVDLMLPVTQPGVYELHNHYLPAVTGNGVYPNGAMILMDAA